MCAHGAHVRGRRSHARATKSEVRNSVRKCEQLYLWICLSEYVLLQDGLVTMHDVMDAQWLLDNQRDGEHTE